MWDICEEGPLTLTKSTRVLEGWQFSRGDVDTHTPTPPKGKAAGRAGGGAHKESLPKRLGVNWFEPKLRDFHRLGRRGAGKRSGGECERRRESRCNLRNPVIMSIGAARVAAGHLGHAALAPHCARRARRRASESPGRLCLTKRSALLARRACHLVRRRITLVRCLSNWHRLYVDECANGARLPRPDG